jgi:hypothetical protein
MNCQGLQHFDKEFPKLPIICENRRGTPESPELNLEICMIYLQRNQIPQRSFLIRCVERLPRCTRRQTAKIADTFSDDKCLGVANFLIGLVPSSE